MEVQPELSLGPTLLGFSVGAGASKSSSSSESDGSSDDGSRKRRKHFAWEEAVSHASLDLHLNDPLPMDWEQCLDLHVSSVYRHAYEYSVAVNTRFLRFAVIILSCFTAHFAIHFAISRSIKTAGVVDRIRLKFDITA